MRFCLYTWEVRGQNKLKNPRKLPDGKVIAGSLQNNPFHTNQTNRTNYRQLRLYIRSFHFRMNSATNIEVSGYYHPLRANRGNEIV